MAARGLGIGQEGCLQFHHQVMNSPGLHLCCLLLLCCLKSGVFWDPFVQEEMCLQWGQRPGGVRRALGGSICSLHRPEPLLPPSLPESLLLQYLMLPVHGSFWGSEGKLTCFSWWPLGSRWALLLLCGVGYAHPICLFVSLECVNIPDPLPFPSPFALSLWVYTVVIPLLSLDQRHDAVFMSRNPVFLADHCSALLWRTVCVC